MTVAYHAFREYMRATRWYSDDMRTNALNRRTAARTAWAAQQAKQVFGTSPFQSIMEAGFDAFEALRLPCIEADSPQRAADMQMLCDAEMDASDIRLLVEAAGANPDEWFDVALSEHDFVITREGYFKSKDDVYYCEYYGEWCDETEEVLVRRNVTENWCEDARDENAFFCDVSEKYYSCSMFSSGETVHGGTICCEIAGNYDYHWSEYQDCYTDADDDDDEDEDEDEEESGRDGTIPHWHGAYRGWDCGVADRSLRAFYGFEIEVDFPSWQERHDYYRDICNPGKDHCAETDGSLNDSTGLELITRPFSLHELKQPHNHVRRMLQDAADAGACDGGPRYGVHITTNAQRLTKPHRRRLRDFLVDTRSMTEFVARRKQTEYCRYVKGDDKHDVAAPRPSGAVEYRMFQSTVDWDVLMSYVDYLEAATEWTRDVYRVTTGAIAQATFRIWVRSQPDTYPYLCARLPQLTAKDTASCVSQLSNPLVELSVKPLSAYASTTILTEQDLRTSAMSGWTNVIPLPDGPTYQQVTTPSGTYFQLVS